MIGNAQHDFIEWNNVFEYKDGHLFWKIKPTKSRVPVGARAGKLDLRGYRKVGYKRKTFLAHRIIWEIFNGRIEAGKCIDHINGKPEDNTITNLRLVTYSENAKNRKCHRDGKYGVRKTSTGKWTAFIHLGSYTTEEEARKVFSDSLEKLRR